MTFIRFRGPKALKRQGKTTTPNDSLKHARSGSDRWTVSNSPLINATSPLRAVAILPLSDFHKVSRAEGPKKTGEDNDAQLFAQTRTLRIRQMDGLELSTDKLDLAAPDSGILSLSHFHEVSRAEGPKRTDGS